MLKDWLADINLLLLPFIAAIGALGRETFDWLRGRRTTAAEIARTDMEVGKALRDELRAEIARQDAMIERQDAECQRRLDILDGRLKAVQQEADNAREEARSLRAALDQAERLIATLKGQVASLVKASA